MASLAINSINPDPVQKQINGPWIMSCPFCSWTSLDIGWQFDKLTNLHQQMSKLRIGGQQASAGLPTPAEGEAASEDMPQPHPDNQPDSVFEALRSFYSSQLSAANPSDPLLTPSGGYNYSSPSSLARIMSLYTGRSFYGKKDQGKGSPMREAVVSSEGLRMIKSSPDENAIEKMRSQGWTSTSSTLQQSNQQQHPPRFAEDLKPLRAQLRTKRSKRCRNCRHILVKPEPKVQSTRYRIRLIAQNYIPTISLKPLHPSPSTQLPMIDLNALPTIRASQYLLTLRNPLFDPINITLATPSHTPDRYRHKVTILCPQFVIGPNIDQWDEVLDNSNVRRVSRSANPSKSEYAGGEGGKVAEAGKVWDKERNWTTVVVEVVCEAISSEADDGAEDEDILEIPFFVRMDWEAEVERDEGGGKVKEIKEKRELAYWAVVGVGRVGKLESPKP